MSYNPFNNHDPTPGDAIAARSTDGYVAAGVVDKLNDDKNPTPGSWLLGIKDATVWRTENGDVETVELDHGPTIDYRYHGDRGLGNPDDWDGPGVDIGIGHNTGEVVLRLPDPIFDSKGVRYYTAGPVGAIEAVDVGEIVEPGTMFDADVGDADLGCVSVPPEEPDTSVGGTTKAQLRPTQHVDPPTTDITEKVPPSKLPDDLNAFARDIAEEIGITAEWIAAECDRMLEKEVPPEEIKSSIRRAVERGRYE